MPISYDDYKKKYADQIEENRKKRRKEREVSFTEYQSGLQQKTNTTTSTKNTSVKEDDDKAWWQEIFQTPKAFKDGYDFGDVTKTILGTTADVGLNVVEGVARVGEGVGTLIAGAGAQVGDWIGQDEWADKVRNRIAGKEKTAFGTTGAPVSSWLNSGQQAIDNYSISGKTGDEISSLVGYTGGLAVGGGALGSAGSIPIKIGAKTLINVPTLAVVGGASSGLTEAYQKEGVSDAQAWAKALGSGAIEGVTEGLFGMFGVGGGELTDQLGKQVASKFTSGLAKTLAKTGVQAGGEGFEEFLSYAGNQALDLLIDKASKEGSPTFYNEWDWEEVGEQVGMAIISAGITQGGSMTFNTYQQTEYAVGEAEKELGRKLTAEEKKSVKEQVKNALVNDTTLNNQEVMNNITENRVSSAGEVDNVTRNEVEVGNIDTEIVNQQLDQDQEKALRSQNFTYEASSNISTQKQAVYESASQVMNNTTRSHEFVETVASISEKTGTNYRFTNTQQLEEMGYKLEGKNIDGLVNQNGEILINIDSNKALNQILGHETTHLLEGTKEYQALQKIAIEYAKTKGEYDSRLATLTTLYEGTNADINNELTSEIVGDYLFTDKAFVEQIATREPNVFQKIYNRIKELLDLVTGNKERKQLAELKRTFEEALKKAKKTSPSNASVTSKANVESTDNQVVEAIEDNSLTEVESNTQEKVETKPKKEVVKEEVKKKEVAKAEKQEATKETKKEVKEEIAPIKEDIAPVKEEVKAEKKTTTPTQEELDNLEDTRLNKSGSEYALEFFRLRDKYGQANLYKGLNNYKSTGKSLETNVEATVTDNQGRTLTKEQQDYFKDSKVRDENGNLLTMYHGTSSGGHTVFDPWGAKVGLFGQGSYFTDNKSVAESYTEKGKGNNQQIYEVYLNITNPIDMDAQGDVQAWAKALSSYSSDIASHLESGTNEQIYRSALDYFAEDGMYDKYERAEIMAEAFEKMGYDGITHIGGGRFNKQDGTRHRVYISLESSQVKNVDNTKPTQEPDIRYSLSATDNKGRELSKGQIEFFKDSKVRDNEGRLLEVYHTTDTEFTIFDVNKFGKNTGGMIKGIYLATEPLGNFGDYTITSYANITNPVTAESKNITKEQFIELLEDKVTKSNIENAWRHYQNSNDLDILYAIQEQYRRNRNYQNNQEFFDNVRKITGYDGIIYSGQRYYANGRVSYVAFNSNQIKNVDNLNPTDDADIRYSLSDYQEYTNELNATLEKAKNVDEQFYNDLKSQQEEYIERHQLEYDILKETGSRPVTNENRNDNFFKEHTSEYDEKRGIKTPDGILTVMHLQKGDNLAKLSFTEGEDKIWIDELYVKNQKQGYGSEIVNAIKNYANKNGKYVEAFKELSTAKGFWDKTLRSDTRYSLTDNQGRELSKEQLEYFKDSKVRDDNGNLLTMYHRADTEFNVFDKNKTGSRNALGRGFYFSGEKQKFNWEHFGSVEKEVYLNITNPLDYNKPTPKNLVEYCSEFKGYNSILGRTVNNLPKEIQKKVKNALNFIGYELKQDTTEVLKDLGYDGIIDEEYRIVAFEPNQIKNVDNLNPTDDADIRYSLSEDILPKVQEGYTRLYRGLGSEYNSNYDRTLLDNNNGYESWTDSYDLAKEYGENVYYIDVPTSEIKNSVIDEDSTSETYGDRNLIYANDKPVGLRGKTGSEYMLYTDHDNYKNIKYNKVPDTNLSLSNKDTDIAPIGDYQVRGEDVRLQQQVQEAIAPLQETIQQLNDKITNLTENIAPVSQELVEQTSVNNFTENDIPVRNNLTLEESQELDTYETLPDSLTEIEQERMAELQAEENLVSDNEVATAENVIDPFENRDIKDVGNRKVKAYMYENPEVKPFFQQEAYAMLGDLSKSVKGEKIWIHEANPVTGLMENTSVTGTTRQTTSDIAYLLDNWNYTYAQIEKGLHDIIEDNGLENNAVSKRIEFLLHDRLKDGYVGIDGTRIPANQDYINLLSDKNITEYSQEAYDNWIKTLPEDYLPYAEFGRTLEDSNTENIQENVQESVQEVQRTTEPSIEDTRLSAIEDLMNKQIARSLPTNEVAQPKVTKRKTKLAFQELFTNRTQAIDDYAVETGNMNIKFTNDHVNNVYGEISTNIVKNQTDNYGNVIGKSITSIFDQARNDGLYEAFNDYLFHLSNIERHKNGKGSQVPLAESQTLKAKYEQAYPVMKKWAKEVNLYNRNNLNKQVESGLVSKGTRDLITSMYDFYVPFMENVDRQYVRNDTGEIIARSTVKRAKGGASNLLGFEEAMIRQTQATITAIRKNNLYKEIVKGTKEKVSIGADFRNDVNDLSSSLYQDENGSYVTAYVDGVQQSAKVNDIIYNELYGELETQLKNVEQRMSSVFKPLQKLSEWRRNLLTTWSPSFMITNPIKDFQDAPLNSKYASDWAKNYPKALKELTTGKGKDGNLDRFLNMYGFGNLMSEYSIDSGVSDGTVIKKNNKFLSKIEQLNNIADLVPRYAEYLASIENGTSQMEALYNAREVTTNFGRGGVITKFLNRNGFTFLNASVQGMSKLIRNFSGENGAKGVTSALIKVAVLGIVPALFNHMMFGDDDEEEYEALPDYIKDNYYLIKTDDGEFIRIPKGRMISIFGSATRRVAELLDGEEDAFEGYLKNAYSQVGVANPLENNILAPLIQAYGTENGRTWYGEDLVPTRLQDVPAGEQYDSSTDKLSIWLGEHLGISPYKLDYVLDQYSGGVGDLLLPLITEEASSDGSLLAPLGDKFKVNSIDDNKYVGDFYSLNEELQKKSNSAYATEEDKLKNQYMYSVSSEMAKLYAERREVQSDSSLSKAEKYKKAQAIKEQINALAKEGLEGYENITKGSNYATVGDKEFYSYIDEESGEKRWRKPNEDELEALNTMGMDVQEKSSYFNAKSKISDITDSYNKLLDNATTQDEKNEIYANKKTDIVSEIRSSNLNDEGKYYLFDKYYGNTEDIEAIKLVGIKADAYLDYASKTFTADKNNKGDTISGSKKKKVFDYINTLDIEFEQKVILAKMEYNTYDEWNYDIIEYLNNSNVTYEEEEFILKRLGFTVDENGNIYWD